VIPAGALGCASFAGPDKSGDERRPGSPRGQGTVPTGAPIGRTAARAAILIHSSSKIILPDTNGNTNFSQTIPFNPPPYFFPHFSQPRSSRPGGRPRWAATIACQRPNRAAHFQKPINNFCLLHALPAKP